MDHERVVAKAEDAVDIFVPGIKAAVRELEAKHGPLTPHMLRAFAILQREVGEVADAVLDLTRTATTTNAVDYEMVAAKIEAQSQHTAHEIAQVIAVCVYMLINLFGDRITSDGPAPVLVSGKDTVN